MLGDVMEEGQWTLNNEICTEIKMLREDKDVQKTLNRLNSRNDNTFN